MWHRTLTSLSQRRVAWVLAMLGGVLLFLGFCGFDLYLLEWFCFVPVLWALDDTTLSHKEAWFIAWLFGAVAHLGVYTWIVGLLRDFGYLPWPLAVLGYLLLCLAQSVLFAVAGYGAWLLKVKYSVPFRWGAPVMLILAEWLVPALFPSYMANSQYQQVLLIQSVDLVGPMGLSALLMLCSAVVYELLAWRFRSAALPTWGLITFVALFTANLLYGLGAITNTDDTVAHADRRLKVGMVQVNMGIYEKDENPIEGARRHREQSQELEAQKVDLIVWPESGYNYGIRTSTTNVAREVMGPLTTPLLFGAIRVDRGPHGHELYNSAFLVDGDGNVQGTYDKTYLLAFGEYLPLGEWLPFLYQWSPHTSRFQAGQHTRPLKLNGISYGMLICYEDILPGFVRKVMSAEPDVLVNLTNDAWFGKTREPKIHLALAIFRAVEHRRYLVRATNTGISAFVDPVGRILAQTPVFARANLVQEITPMSGRTPYAVMGDWVAWLSLGLAVFWMRSLWLWRSAKPHKKK